MHIHPGFSRTSFWTHSIGLLEQFSIDIVFTVVIDIFYCSVLINARFDLPFVYFSCFSIHVNKTLFNTDKKGKITEFAYSKSFKNLSASRRWAQYKLLK